MNQTSEDRNIRMIAEEIQHHKQNMERYDREKFISTFEIGRLLKESKIILAYGNWGAWLKKEFQYCIRTAQRFIQVFEAYKEETTLGSQLGYTKAFLLLKIKAPDERKNFMSEPHEVVIKGNINNVKKKSVFEMTKRELEEVLTKNHFYEPKPVPASEPKPEPIPEPVLKLIEIYEKHFGRKIATSRDIEIIDDALAQAKHKEEVVSVGKMVTFKDVKQDKEVSWEIVENGEGNPDKRKVTGETSLGKALIGAKIGDILEYDLPDGVRRKIEILDILKSA